VRRCYQSEEIRSNELDSFGWTGETPSSVRHRCLSIALYNPLCHMGARLLQVSLQSETTALQSDTTALRLSTCLIDRSQLATTA
jgi:hypothetical protein